MQVLRTPLQSLAAPEEPTQSKSRRSWREKFHGAFRGVKLGIRGHSSFSVHFFFSALVIAAGVVLHCEMVEWCLLFLCMAIVLTAELFNSAVEMIFHGLDEITKPRVRPCLDIAAGAVLMASIGAAIVGGVVLISRLMKFLS